MKAPNGISVGITGPLIFDGWNTEAIDTIKLGVASHSGFLLFEACLDRKASLSSILLTCSFTRWRSPSASEF
jgi:hypothetical protein